MPSPRAVRQGRGLAACRHAELAQDVGHVDAGGLAGDEQLLGDLPVGVALGDEPQDLELAGGESVFVEVGGVAPAGGSPVIDAGQPAAAGLSPRWPARRAAPLPRSAARVLQRTSPVTRRSRRARLPCPGERLGVAQQRVGARMRLVDLHRWRPPRRARRRPCWRRPRRACSACRERLVAVVRRDACAHAGCQLVQRSGARLGVLCLGSAVGLDSRAEPRRRPATG